MAGIWWREEGRSNLGLSSSTVMETQLGLNLTSFFTVDTYVMLFLNTAS